MKTAKDMSLESGQKYGWGLILLYPNELKQFLKQIHDELGRIDILEVGCYKGFLVGWLHENFPRPPYRWNYIGVDIVEPPDRRKDYPHYIMNAEALEFPAHSFDVVIMIETLEHVPDYVRALREAYRVLRPRGGIFIQSVMCTDPNALKDEQHFHVLHPVTLKRLLEWLGFTDCRYVHDGNFAIWCRRP